MGGCEDLFSVVLGFGLCFFVLLFFGACAAGGGRDQKRGLLEKPDGRGKKLKRKKNK